MVLALKVPRRQGRSTRFPICRMRKENNIPCARVRFRAARIPCSDPVNYDPTVLGCAAGRCRASRGRSLQGGHAVGQGGHAVGQGGHAVGQGGHAVGQGRRSGLARAVRGAAGRGPVGANSAAASGPGPNRAPGRGRLPGAGHSLPRGPKSPGGRPVQPCAGAPH